MQFFLTSGGVLAGRERYQGEVAGAFDGGGKFALMAGAEAGFSARINLPARAQKLAEILYIFVVHATAARRTKKTLLFMFLHN